MPSYIDRDKYKTTYPCTIPCI